MRTQTETSQTPLTSLPRNVWVVTITSFLTDMSSEMVINLLPLFLVNVLGARTVVVGLIEGIADSTASVLKVFSGWLSDRLRRRKALTVAGYSLSAVSKGFLYFAATWMGVTAVRFVDRVGKGIRTAPRDALIADSIDARHRGLAFGLHRAGDTFGAFAGLGIALAVVAGTGLDTMALSRDLFQTIVLISIVPAVLAVFVLVLGARETPIRSQAAAPRLSLTEMPPSFRRFLVVATVFTLGNSSDAFLTLRAQERGLSIAAILGVLMTFNLIYAVASGPAGALSDRIGRKRLILFGWAVYAVIYVGFAAATKGWHIWVLYGVYGLYYAAFEGASKAFIADLVPAEKRGTAYGIYNTAIGAVALPASLLAGALWQGIGSWRGFGPSAPFVFGAALSAVACGLLVAWSPSDRRPAA